MSTGASVPPFGGGIFLGKKRNFYKTVEFSEISRLIIIYKRFLGRKGGQIDEGVESAVQHRAFWKVFTLEETISCLILF